jgi:hypothetical protein
VAKVIEPGSAEYSDIAVTRKGVVLCIYGVQGKAGDRGARIDLIRLDLDVLENVYNYPQ